MLSKLRKQALQRYNKKQVSWGFHFTFSNISFKPPKMIDQKTEQVTLLRGPAPGGGGGKVEALRNSLICTFWLWHYHPSFYHTAINNLHTLTAHCTRFAFTINPIPMLLGKDCATTGCNSMLSIPINKVSPHKCRQHFTRKVPSQVGRDTWIFDI